MGPESSIGCKVCTSSAAMARDAPIVPPPVPTLDRALDVAALNCHRLHAVSWCVCIVSDSSLPPSPLSPSIGGRRNSEVCGFSLDVSQLVLEIITSLKGSHQPMDVVKWTKRLLSTLLLPFPVPSPPKGPRFGSFGTEYCISVLYRVSRTQ